MKNIDLSNLTLDDFASWPKPVKLVLIGISCVLLIGAAYFFDTRAQQQTLAGFQKKEVKLKKTYSEKYHHAANLIDYQKQLEEIRLTLRGMLYQLPSKTEVPALLEDVSNLGQKNGLKFSLFKPRAEKKYEFYSELPISMHMSARYHQIASFVSDVSALDRIVTIGDFKLEPVAGEKDKPAPEGELTVSLTAKTYRYLD